MLAIILSLLLFSVEALKTRDTSSISERRFKTEIEQQTGIIFEKAYPKWLINKKNYPIYISS